MAEGHAFVVMAHGDSPFLASALASLRAQTLPATILITTSTPSAAIEAQARAHGAALIVNPVRAGIAADWNFALEASDARWATLAHQDDVYRPRFLEETLATLRAIPEAALSFTGYDEITDDGATTRSKISLAKHTLERLALGGATRVTPGRMRAFLALGNPLPCSSVTFDRVRLAGFRFSGAYQSNLDWDAWLRLADEGRLFARVRERLVGRRHNALTATSRLIQTGVRAREDLAMFERIWPRPLARLIATVYRAGY